MARKKGKKKIKVRLELPKDDSTETNFTIILVLGMMLGMSCMGFWITNADLVFKPMNQMPMFLNLALFDRGAEERTYRQQRTYDKRSSIFFFLKIPVMSRSN